MTLREIFPEIDWIADAVLQEKTVRCLELAVDKGGWSLEELTRIPFTLLIPKCPVSLVQHTRNVTKLSAAAYDLFSPEYGKYYKLNRDHLISGAILHDVGKIVEYRKDGDWFAKSVNGKFLRHPFSGANLAAISGLPEEVVHIIAVHAHEGDEGYRSPEARIVNHADFMNFEPLRDTIK